MSAGDGGVPPQATWLVARFDPEALGQLAGWCNDQVDARVGVRFAAALRACGGGLGGDIDGIGVALEIRRLVAATWHDGFGAGGEAGANAAVAELLVDLWVQMAVVCGASPDAAEVAASLALETLEGSPTRQLPRRWRELLGASEEAAAGRSGCG